MRLLKLWTVFCKKERVMEQSSICGFKSRFVCVWAVSLLFLAMCQTHVFGGKIPAPVEKTGQTKSYSNTGGEDGDLENGVKWPRPRFRDNGDGTVKDNLTGLIWLKNANAFGWRTWEQALADSNTLASGSAGLSDGSKAGDWRLPNRNELLSLIDIAYYGPALSSASGKSQWTSEDAFASVLLGYYWSSTTDSFRSTHAWCVDLTGGYSVAYNKTDVNYVWPVRTGK